MVQAPQHIGGGSARGYANEAISLAKAPFFKVSNPRLGQIFQALRAAQ